MGLRYIYIIDSKLAVQRSLGILLGSLGYHFRSYFDAAAFLDESDHVEPGCVLLNVALHNGRNLNVLRSLARTIPVFPTIILTEFADIDTAVTAMKLGVQDVLETPYREEHLVKALNYGFAALLSADGKTKQARDREQFLQLTKRQRQVLFGVSQGYSNKTIAGRLNIQPRTVEMHRADMMARLGINNLAELVRFALAIDFDDVEIQEFAPGSGASRNASVVPTAPSG